MNTIVVVDDDVESRDATAAQLTAHGYDVAPTSGAAEALMMIAARRPAAVVFRILHPASGAIDFVRRIALDRSATPVPLVMITELSEYQISSFLDGIPGVRRVLYPPFTPDALRRAIDRVLPTAEQQTRTIA